MPSHRYPPNRRLAHALVDDGRERREIARLARVSGPTFSGYITGRTRPRLSIAFRIAQVLSRDVDELFDTEEEVAA